MDDLYSELKSTEKQDTRFSVSISAEAATDLDGLAVAYGLSRAALAKSLLQAAIKDLKSRKD
jgi:hypothetical protein